MYKKESTAFHKERCLHTYISNSVLIDETGEGVGGESESLTL